MPGDYSRFPWLIRSFRGERVKALGRPGARRRQALPPSLICIEEPELGLHPDLLPKLADLMIDTSARAQLVVTTHSDIFVDAMTEQPESVVVVEKHDARTVCERLEATDPLKQWLDKYRLGQLWTNGELGGVRW